MALWSDECGVSDGEREASSVWGGCRGEGGAFEVFVFVGEASPVFILRRGESAMSREEN